MGGGSEYSPRGDMLFIRQATGPYLLEETQNDHFLKIISTMIQNSCHDRRACTGRRTFRQLPIRSSYEPHVGKETISMAGESACMLKFEQYTATLRGLEAS